MCGRYKLVVPTGRIFDEFSLMGRRLNLQPRYNIAPTQEAPVVRLTPTGRQISLIRWGFIPSWSPSLKPGASVPSGHINARAETVADKPSFRDAFQHRRCLVVTDGFYEWATVGRVKQPMLFEMRDGGPFAFAGLYECWENGGVPLETFTIICTEANALVGEVHDRMPVILPKDSWSLWLDAGAHGPADALPLLKPFPAADMTVRPVNRSLNRVGVDDPSVLTPSSPEQPSLF